MKKTVYFHPLRETPYNEAWEEQHRIFNELTTLKQKGESHQNQHLLFFEHPPVYTLGKNGKQNNLLITPELCKERNIDYFPIDRGGDITFHGKGQLVVYPILDLEQFSIGVKEYIFMLEEVIIESLIQYDIHSTRIENASGVWLIDEKRKRAEKICAIGVKLSRYITMHGFALNINTDLSYFNFINPCGFVDKGVTSMEKEKNQPIDMLQVCETVKVTFARLFNIDFIER